MPEDDQPAAVDTRPDSDDGGITGFTGKRHSHRRVLVSVSSLLTSAI